MATIITSNQFTLNMRDLIRGLILGIIVAVIPIIQETITTWVDGGDFILNYREIVGISWKTTVGYLTLNFFNAGKVITVPEKDKGENVHNTARKVKEAIPRQNT